MEHYICQTEQCLSALRLLLYVIAYGGGSVLLSIGAVVLYDCFMGDQDD